MATWREISLKVIHERYTSIKEGQPQLRDEVILRMVSLHYYPFGERACWPYKAWLKALRDYKAARKVGLVGALSGAKQISGDLPLFDEQKQ